jgi:EAL domain-containing protein (putative c-di-GMP-specific phosphodiesterase class I)
MTKIHISDSYSRKIKIKSKLKNSIINNELYLCYQPQINTLLNTVIGVEALLRWNNNELGNISPSEFIPIAEHSGYIVDIGNWVLDEALKTACIWKQKGYKFNAMSINVSPIQLKLSDFKENLLNTCAKYDISPFLLEIEITEGTLMDIGEDKIKVFNELRENGVSIALDDFGTGYSSFKYLINLPFNILKIDKSLIDNIESDKNKAVIKSIVCLSKSLKYKIIVEGVETKEQVDLLLDLGCNIIQGYYYSKPLSAENFEKYIIKKEWK